MNPLANSSRINPGVGNYNLGDEAGKSAVKYSFGKGNRISNSRPNTPGPGTYQTKNFMGKDGPKITISSKRPQSGNGDVNQPGPGAYSYNLNDRISSPKYGFGSAKRDNRNKEAEGVPGAGSYQPGERLRSPEWSMGKSTRGNKSNNEWVPGPGNYEYYSSVGNGPKVINNIFYFKI